MTNGSGKSPSISSAYGRRSYLSEFQRRIEYNASALRVELNLFDLDVLHQDNALALIPNCQVWAFKNIPNLPFEAINRFRTKAARYGALAFRHEDGTVFIAFNDSHPIEAVRVHLMEEFFHLRLGHPPDKVRSYQYPYRTYDKHKEEEAFGCAAAALVPYGGLEAMLANNEHISRIAEYFHVPLEVIEFRIGVTKLAYLTLKQARQISLLATVRRQQIAPG